MIILSNFKKISSYFEIYLKPKANKVKRLKIYIKPNLINSLLGFLNLLSKYLFFLMQN